MICSSSSIIAVGDLNKFIQREHNYRSRCELDVNMFVPDTRPPCITSAYEKSCTTPVHLIRAIDSFRKDGRNGSTIFVCQPVFSDVKKKITFMDIETQKVSLESNHTASMTSSWEVIQKEMKPF